MLNSSGSALEYAQQIVPIEDSRDTSRVVKILAGLQDFVVLDIAGSAEMQPVALTDENLRQILAAVPAALFVYGLPMGKYKKFLRERIGRLGQSVLSLRSALRTHYVSDLGEEFRGFLSQAEQVMVLLDCYLLKQARPALSQNTARIQDFVRRLATAGYVHQDNVSCMDWLYYEILPALKNIPRALGK